LQILIGHGCRGDVWFGDAVLRHFLGWHVDRLSVLAARYRNGFRCNFDARFVRR
jgi:hypothetical protein